MLIFKYVKFFFWTLAFFGLSIMTIRIMQYYWLLPPNEVTVYVPVNDDTIYSPYDLIETAPIVFISGYNGSGMHILCKLLNAHTSIRCAEEPRVTLDVLKLGPVICPIHIIPRLRSVGVYPDAYESAMARFVLEITKQTGPEAPLLCHQQSQMLEYIPLLERRFPKGKFINVVQDGRFSVAYSLNVKKSPWDILKEWESDTHSYLTQCKTFGPEKCLTVRAENLVLHPERQLFKILEFLGIASELGDVNFNEMLQKIKSTFFNELDKNQLAQWSDPSSKLPADFIKTAHTRSNLLNTLNYVSVGIPPNYSKLAESII